MPAHFVLTLCAVRTWATMDWAWRIDPCYDTHVPAAFALNNFFLLLHHVVEYPRCLSLPPTFLTSLTKVVLSLFTISQERCFDTLITLPQLYIYINPVASDVFDNRQNLDSQSREFEKAAIRSILYTCI